MTTDDVTRIGDALPYVRSRQVNVEQAPNDVMVLLSTAGTDGALYDAVRPVGAS